jgi:hypothetical protein
VNAEDVRLEVERKLVEEDDYDTTIEALADIAQNAKLFVYDIKLVHSSGDVIQPTGRLKLSLAVPEGMDPDRIEVYRIESDEENPKTLLECEISDNANGDGKMLSFYTDHFSLYAMVERAPALDPVPDPKPPGAPIVKTNLSAASVSVANQVWTGNAQKPAPVVKLGAKQLVAGKDYAVVGYTNNKNIGTAKVTIAGLGDYTGLKELAFKIQPKAPTKLKLTAAKKSLKVKWTKSAKYKAQKITGYQVQYKVKGAATWKTKTIAVSYKAKATTVTKAITKLKAKKNYQVRVRAYKNVKGVKYVSAWTRAQKAKTK